VTSVLITGAAGFVAAHLVRKFRDEGFTVFATDIRVPNSDDPLSQVLDDAHLRTLDLRDGDATDALISELRPDGIVHAAGIVGPANSLVDPRRNVDVNVRCTQVLLDGAVTVGARLTFLSTATLYGTRPDLLPLPETERPDPVGMYDATKLMAEVLIEAYRRSLQLSAVVVRFGFPYGLGQSIDQYFLPRVLRGEEISEPSGRDHPSDFVYIDDLVEGIYRAHTTPAPLHHLYNIGSGVLRTRGEFAAAVMAAVPGSHIELGPGLQPGRHLRGPLDITRARIELGYQPAFTIERGVQAWARDLGRSTGSH
jgi:nucleoside-diphosphate-sugar epimerase